MSFELVRRAATATASRPAAAATVAAARSSFNATALPSDGFGDGTRSSPVLWLSIAICLPGALFLLVRGRAGWRITTACGLGYAFALLGWLGCINSSPAGSPVQDGAIVGVSLASGLLGAAVGAWPAWRIGMVAIGGMGAASPVVGLILLGNDLLIGLGGRWTLVLLAMLAGGAAVCVTQHRAMSVTTGQAGALLLAIAVDAAINVDAGMTHGLRLLFDGNVAHAAGLVGYRPPTSTRIIICVSWLIGLLAAWWQDRHFTGRFNRHSDGVDAPVDIPPLKPVLAKLRRPRDAAKPVVQVNSASSRLPSPARDVPSRAPSPLKEAPRASPVSRTPTPIPATVSSSIEKAATRPIAQPTPARLAPPPFDPSSHHAPPEVVFMRPRSIVAVKKPSLPALARPPLGPPAHSAPSAGPRKHQAHAAAATRSAQKPAAAAPAPLPDVVKPMQFQPMSQPAPPPSAPTQPSLAIPSAAPTRAPSPTRRSWLGSLAMDSRQSLNLSLASFVPSTVTAPLPSPPPAAVIARPASIDGSVAFAGSRANDIGDDTPASPTPSMAFRQAFAARKLRAATGGGDAATSPRPTSTWAQIFTAAQQAV